MLSPDKPLCYIYLVYHSAWHVCVDEGVVFQRGLDLRVIHLCIYPWYTTMHSMCMCVCGCQCCVSLSTGQWFVLSTRSNSYVCVCIYIPGIPPCVYVVIDVAVVFQLHLDGCLSSQLGVIHVCISVHDIPPCVVCRCCVLT